MEKQTIIQVLDYPYSFTVEPTAYCNLKCKMCHNPNMKRERGYMDLKLYKKIVDEVSDKFSKSKFWLAGIGEPLLHRNIVEMVSYASSKGIKVLMNTNATLLDEKMAEALMKAGIHGIIASIDGFSKEMYESLRIGGDRDVVYKNLEYALELKQKMNLPDMEIELQFIEYNEALIEKDQWVNYWKEKGANIKLKSPITWGGTVETGSEIPADRKPCGHSNTLNVCWDGRVSRCSCGDVDGNDIIGNVNTDLLYDIWNKIKVPEFSSYHAQYKFDKLPAYCQKCTDWYAAPAKHEKSSK